MFGAGMVGNLLALGCCQFVCRTEGLFGYGRLPDLRIRFEHHRLQDVSELFMSLIISSVNGDCPAIVYLSQFRHQMSDNFTWID